MPNYFKAQDQVSELKQLIAEDQKSQRHVLTDAQRTLVSNFRQLVEPFIASFQEEGDASDFSVITALTALHRKLFHSTLDKSFTSCIISPIGQTYYDALVTLSDALFDNAYDRTKANIHKLAYVFLKMNRPKLTQALAEGCDTIFFKDMMRFLWVNYILPMHFCDKKAIFTKDLVFANGAIGLVFGTWWLTVSGVATAIVYGSEKGKILNFQQEIQGQKQIREVFFCYRFVNMCLMGEKQLIAARPPALNPNFIPPNGNHDIQSLLDELGITYEDAETALSRSHPEFLCPIYETVMLDPVILSNTGHVFDRSSITQWLSIKKTDPLSGLPLTDTTLTPNLELRKAIMRALKEQFEKVELSPQTEPEGVKSRSETLKM